MSTNSQRGVSEWTLAKLEELRENDRVLLRDPLRLLPEADGGIHTFAQRNGFTVVVAATNLVFRELYERAKADSGTKKLLVIDRAPARRTSSTVALAAAPPFYPDLLFDTPVSSRVNLDLRQYLTETTNDPHWPGEANEPLYARLIVRHLEGVIRAHENLRAAHPGRFTDNDFKTIIAFAALGVADSAFKRLRPHDYWRIGLLSHSQLEELGSLTPEVTTPIRTELGKAPAPFCWFADHDAEVVVRTFYLALILAQHTENWNLLLANVDPSLAPFTSMKREVLMEAGPKLVALDREQAQRDIEEVERSLSRETLQLILLDQMQIGSPSGFASAIEKESYSTLVSSLALLLALDDLLSNQPATNEQVRVAGALFLEEGKAEKSFVETRSSVAWSNLREAYRLTSEILPLCKELENTLKKLKVLKSSQLSHKFFRDLWNERRINRLEYYLSALERLVYSADFLVRPEDELPSRFGNALLGIRQRIRTIADECNRHLDEMNARFQELVVTQYSSWTAKDGEIYLTSQFLHRCLKPHWDPQKEKALVLIFDGMRYDIWDELLRPMVEDRMEVLADLPASSILPSETHVTRKAISAGAFADEFDTRAGEDKLLRDGMAREFGYTGGVEVLIPEGGGAGETVRYRAGHVDVYIFDLCDKELHKIQTKTLPDGREVPTRPLAFVYQQHIKNIIDTEVMAVVRSLAPGTKVFVTADHGFARVNRRHLWLDKSWLNEPGDCAYLNARLMQSLKDAGAPTKLTANVWELPVATLRMPSAENVVDKKTKQARHKKYATMIFPKTGYSLSRPDSHFNPDAYTHGGISVQELMIPMVVLRVKAREEGLLTLDAIQGPNEVIEGEEVEFRLRIIRPARGAGKAEDIRADLEPTYSREPDKRPLPRQVLYVPSQGAEAVIRFRPDPNEPTEDERRKGLMERTFAVTVTYYEGRRASAKSRAHAFTIHLNSERIVRRVPTHLGSILGLTPKTMK